MPTLNVADPGTTSAGCTRHCDKETGANPPRDPQFCPVNNDLEQSTAADVRQSLGVHLEDHGQKTGAIDERPSLAVLADGRDVESNREDRTDDRLFLSPLAADLPDGLGAPPGPLGHQPVNHHQREEQTPATEPPSIRFAPLQMSAH